MIYQETFQLGEDPNSQNISIVRYQDIRPLQARPGFPPHSHAFYELELTCDHSVFVEFDNRKIKVHAGSLVFLPPLCIHSFTESARQGHLVMQFTNRLLQNNLPGFSENHVLTPDSVLQQDGQLDINRPENHRIKEVLHEITELVPPFYLKDADPEIRPVSFPPADRLHLSALIIMLLAEMLKKEYLRIENPNPNTAPLPQMQLLIKQLIEHPEEKLSMEDAASMTNMGYSHFCRTFKSTTGYAYVDFCNIQRVARAKEMLKYTDLSVTEISIQLNFGSISYFNRVFKKFTDMSPLAYRIYSRSKS